MQNDLITRKNPPIKPLLFTTRQTAALLNVSERTIWNLKRQGKLPLVRISGKVLYDLVDILHLIETSKEPINRDIGNIQNL